MCFCLSGNPLEGLQKALVDPNDDGGLFSSSSPKLLQYLRDVGRQQKALIHSIESFPSPKLLSYLRMASSLESVIVGGLSSSSSSEWAVFLTRGLYDPRLFLFIWGQAFANPLLQPPSSSDEEVSG